MYIREPSPNGRVFRKWCTLLVDFDDSPLNIYHDTSSRKQQEEEEEEEEDSVVDRERDPRIVSHTHKTPI